MESRLSASARKEHVNLQSSVVDNNADRGHLQGPCDCNQYLFAYNGISDPDPYPDHKPDDLSNGTREG